MKQFTKQNIKLTKEYNKRDSLCLYVQGFIIKLQDVKYTKTYSYHFHLISFFTKPFVYINLGFQISSLKVPYTKKCKILKTLRARKINPLKLSLNLTTLDMSESKD